LSFLSISCANFFYLTITLYPFFWYKLNVINFFTLTHFPSRFINFAILATLLSLNTTVFAGFNFITSNVSQGSESVVTFEASDLNTIVDVFIITPDSLKLPIDSFVLDGESVTQSFTIKPLFLSNTGSYYLIAIDSNSNNLIASDSFSVTKKGFSLSNFFVGGDENLLAQANDEEENEIIAGIENPRFEFIDFPESVSTFEEITFTLNAINIDGELDTNYLGEIAFEVLDDQNATVPTNFEFTEDNAGSHQFNTSIQFTQTGEQILRVFDINDETLEAAVKVQVEQIQVQEQELSEINLTSPLAGISNNNRVNFTGTTDVGVEVRILESDSLFDTTSSNENGEFSFTTSPLADGDYKFKVQTDNAESEVINITIDSLSASLVDFAFNPESVVAGNQFDLSLTFDSEVNSASVIINGVQTNLSATDNSKKRFAASIVSPLLPDEYNVSVVIVDTLGTSNSFQLESPLNVVAPPSDSIVTDGLDDVDQFVIPDFSSRDVFGNPPTAPSNLNGTVSDKRVDLNWDSSTDDLGIAFYTIKYGKSQNDLGLSVETATDQTTWFIPNLDVNSRYFFKVFAIDLDGNQSVEGSNVISLDIGRPESTSYYGQVDPGTDVILDDEDLVIGGPDLDGLTTSDTGPSNILVGLFSFLTGGYFVNRRNKG